MSRTLEKLKPGGRGTGRGLRQGLRGCSLPCTLFPLLLEPETGSEPEKNWLLETPDLHPQKPLEMDSQDGRGWDQGVSSFRRLLTWIFSLNGSSAFFPF